MPARSVTTLRTLEARWRMIAVYKLNKTASRESIAKAAKVSPKTARRWIPVYIKTGDVVDPETRPGPHVGTHTATSAAALHESICAIQGTQGKSVKETAHGLGVSPDTI